MLNAESKESKVVYLDNGTSKIGVLLNAGGRIVALHHKLSENLILADESKWSDDQWEDITLNEQTWWEYPNYHGHAVWVGPQSQWYKHQELYNFMQDKNWPPDKHLNLTTYTVLKKDAHSISVQSPTSPISGLQFTKTYSIKGNKVSLHVSAKNVSNKTHKWTLWSLTRVRGDADVWMQPDKKNRYAEYKDHVGHELIMHKHQEWLYNENAPLKANERRLGKFFSDCKTPVMAAFDKKHCLIVEFDKVPANQLPDDHSNIEIFQNQNPAENISFIELEHHNPYTTLKPNETMELNETWTVVPTDADKHDEQLAFLLKQLK